MQLSVLFGFLPLAAAKRMSSFPSGNHLRKRNLKNAKKDEGNGALKGAKKTAGNQVPPPGGQVDGGSVQVTPSILPLHPPQPVSPIQQVPSNQALPIPVPPIEVQQGSPTSSFTAAPNGDSLKPPAELNLPSLHLPSNLLNGQQQNSESILLSTDNLSKIGIPPVGLPSTTEPHLTSNPSATSLSFISSDRESFQSDPNPSTISDSTDPFSLLSRDPSVTSPTGLSTATQITQMNVISGRSMSTPALVGIIVSVLIVCIIGMVTGYKKYTVTQRKKNAKKKYEEIMQTQIKDQKVFFQEASAI